MIALHIACQWSTSQMYIDRELSDHTTISCIINSEQSSNHLSSQSFSGITYKVQSLATSFSWPITLVPRVYHSTMQLQPAIDTTWEVLLGYFFAEYHTGWNRLYKNMILAEIDCSTVHSISLYLGVTLYRLKFFVKSPDRWSLFQSALLLASFCSTKDCCNKNKVSQFQYTEIVVSIKKWCNYDVDLPESLLEIIVISWFLVQTDCVGIFPDS